MIVCVCNGLREKQVRGSVHSGCTRPSQIYAHFGCKPQCGKCAPYARKLIREETAVAAQACA